MNKRLLFLIISILLIVILVGVVVWVFWFRPAFNWRTYIDKGAGFEIQYPSNLLRISGNPCEINIYREDYSPVSLTASYSVQFSHWFHYMGACCGAAPDDKETFLRHVGLEVCSIDYNYQKIASYDNLGLDDFKEINIAGHKGFFFKDMGKDSQQIMDSYFLDNGDAGTIILRFNYDLEYTDYMPDFQNRTEKFIYENRGEIFQQILSTFKFINN